MGAAPCLTLTQAVLARHSPGPRQPLALRGRCRGSLSASFPVCPVPLSPPPVSRFPAPMGTSSSVTGAGSSLLGVGLGCGRASASLGSGFRAGWADRSSGPPSVLPFCASKLLYLPAGVSAFRVHAQGCPPSPTTVSSSPRGLQAVAVLYEGSPPGPVDGGPVTLHKGKRRAWGGETLSLLLCTSDREQRDPTYLKDKVTQRHSKEQFETAQKIEQEYSRYFTGRRASGLQTKSRQWGRRPGRCHCGHQHRTRPADRCRATSGVLEADKGGSLASSPKFFAAQWQVCVPAAVLCGRAPAIPGRQPGGGGCGWLAFTPSGKSSVAMRFGQEKLHSRQLWSLKHNKPKAAWLQCVGCHCTLWPPPSAKVSHLKGLNHTGVTEAGTVLLIQLYGLLGSRFMLLMQKQVVSETPAWSFCVCVSFNL